MHMLDDERGPYQALVTTAILLAIVAGCFEFQAIGVAFADGNGLNVGYVRLRALRALRALQDSEVTEHLSGTSETEALLGFREDITTDLGAALSTWNITTNPDVCTWTGVTCDVSGRVSALNLSDLQLAGEISNSIGKLTSLSSLMLANNSFHGQIPPSLGLLKQLEYLDMSGNNFSGSIPREIANCSLLTHLLLSKNNLTGFIPSELGMLTRISELSLNFNHLTFSIPRSLGNCSFLSVLNLSFNSLRGKIPDELGRLQSLSTLDLSSNILVGSIPKVIFSNCTSLTIVNMYINQLTGEIPHESGLPPRLGTLSIWSNYLSGPIPSSFANISTLYGLAVGGYPTISTMYGLPVGGYPNTANDNPMGLTGNIPPEFGRLNRLYFLLIYFTNVTGSIPPELGNLTNLAYLYLPNNQLTGVIPPSLGNLNRVMAFILEYNHLVGRIPETFGGLERLEWFSVQDNHLTGGIPKGLGNLTRLFKLYLSYNHLSGEVIPELGNLVSMQRLYLDNNFLSGAIPSTIGNLVNLIELSLASNNLSGSIPWTMLAASSALSVVNISHNNFDGRIPLEIGKLVITTVIDFSFNSLSGTIPSTIEDCKGVSILNFSNNHLSGNLPISALEQLYDLKVFTVANNNLEGPIPEPEGAFARISADNYAGNPGLCGAILRKKCSGGLSGKACDGIKCHTRWILIASGISAFLLLAISALGMGLWIALRRKKKKLVHFFGRNDSIVPINFYTKDMGALTVNDLWVATDSFSKLNILGVGARSTVYKAVTTINEGLIFAVKCVSLDLTGKTTNSDSNRLQRELDILGNLRHRNLVKLHGFCATTAFQALLIEYVPNGTLEEHLHPRGEGEGRRQGCQLNFETRLNIAAGVADALAYLHHECHEPVIHMDLKPSNILLSCEFTPKVTDFGIARHVHLGSLREETTFSCLYGTTGYIPPEYATTNKVSTRGDVYSYGVIILEMMTGRRPTDEDLTKECPYLSEGIQDFFPGQISCVLDETLNTELPVYKEQILMLVRIGLLCTCLNPTDRPAMLDIRRMVWDVQEAMNTKDKK